MARGSSEILDPESPGDGVGGDVVVGRADAAGGEDIIVARAQRVQRGDDVVLDIGNDADFAGLDPDLQQEMRDVMAVGIAGAAGQDLVADHQHGGGDALVSHGGLGHRRALSFIHHIDPRARDPDIAAALQQAEQVDVPFRRRIGEDQRARP